jgi:glycosyltransferase involved in cell wall biosynthesis
LTDGPKSRSLLEIAAMPETTDIILPIYNEEVTVEELVERLGRACPGANLIFVDNASTDRTLEILSRLPVRLIRHSENLGYGRSILDGIAASSAERIVMIDADLEYWPEDVPALLARLDSADAVFGSRLLGAPTLSRSLPWTRAMGNRLVTALFNLLFGQSLTDLYTGLRAVRRSSLPRGGLHCSGFELVLEFAARLATSGARIAEVPARYTPRAAGESKMRHARELAKFAYHLVRLRIDEPDAAARRGSA